MLEELIQQVEALFAKADVAVAGFQAMSGLHCAAGCMSCCHSEKVEASVAEMLPMARHLLATGQGELLLKRLYQEESRVCLLFRPDLAETLGGGCSQYQHRPLICRLFGFAGSRDKNSTPRLSRCREMQIPPHFDLQRLPLFSDFGHQLSALHPGLAVRRLPINQALSLALEKVGLYVDLTVPPVASEPMEPPFSPKGTPTSRKKAA